jgi:hypothetical protein
LQKKAHRNNDPQFTLFEFVHCITTCWRKRTPSQATHGRPHKCFWCGGDPARPARWFVGKQGEVPH